MADLSVTRYYTNITGIPAAQYYGPLYLTEVLAKYPGPIIFVYPYTGETEDSLAISPTLIVQEYGGTSAWTPAVEAQNQVEWQLAIEPTLKKKGIFQGGVYYLPPAYGFSAAELLPVESSNSALEYLGSFSHHNYPQTASAKANASAPVLAELMSHVNITDNVAPYGADTAATDEYGLTYVFGETNSVSGGGSPDISPTFGAGLWVLDYVLRATSSNIAKLNFHFQSYGTSYYIWWDEQSIRSPYYGGFVATDALAGESYITALDDGTSNYAAYVVYSVNKTPSKVVLINTDYFNGTGTRSSHNFVISGLTSKTISAKRLTANSALSRQDQGDAPTYAGQSFSNSGNCALTGKKETEQTLVSGGKATLKLYASEALVITL
ncbi:hypothetical protein SBRCBS47491_006591 [Sporothrix bragantina]|uniref:Beta-glucuronidase C-terminal domain-containing protein n=1 Tax=Sporothrix bragantina TaxID=671064 RepID=A0ABP0C8A9_9PEZI